MTGIADTTCSLCGAETAHHLYGVNALGMTPQRFAIRRCPSCGLYQLSPRPSPQQARTFYPPDYEPFRAARVSPSNGPRHRLRQHHWRIRCRAVQRFHRQGRLLDVGCGSGEFLDEMRRSGNWQVAGVEVSETAAAHAQQVLGLTVYLGDLLALDLPSQSFDVVTMWDVIEHVPNPLETLREIARLLKPDGTLLLSTPNGRAWQARCWQQWWYGWEIPRHIHIFTPPTLLQALAVAGFRITRRFCFPAERFYLVEGLRRRITAAQTGSPSGWARWLPTCIGVVLWPLLRLIDHTPFASQITLAAQLQGKEAAP